MSFKYRVRVGLSSHGPFRDQQVIHRNDGRYGVIFRIGVGASATLGTTWSVIEVTSNIACVR